MLLVALLGLLVFVLLAVVGGPPSPRQDGFQQTPRQANRYENHTVDGLRQPHRYENYTANRWRQPNRYENHTVNGLVKALAFLGFFALCALCLYVTLSILMLAG